MHEATELCYLEACDSLETQVLAMVEGLSHQRQRELALVELAKERWAVAVHAVKEPFAIT
jgi:hypothetical protein